MDYLSGKYFKGFEMVDEAEYWISRDENLLQEKFIFLDGIIKSFQADLETISMKKSESVEEYIIRIANDIHQRNKSSNPRRKK